ncbi:eukaryotic translation initiation factor 3 subunit J [Trichophaea hybrida]|nr:eukaryotic translation initiation factor 3 subunit J [Trichophaea hybrida]
MTPPPKKWDDEEESEEEEEESSEEETGAKVAVLGPKKKWDDEEEEEVLDSWDAAADSEEERKKEAKKKAAAEAAAAEAAANKKFALERIAEKKAAVAVKKAAEDAERTARENETPAEKRARQQARELEADIAHAEDLFSAVGIGAGSGTSGRDVKPVAIVDPKDPSKSIDLAALAIFKPTTKAQFDALRDVLVPLLVANTKKPHYNLFLQEFTRAIAKEMPSEQIRLVASKLTILSNEKQKEEKEAAKSGKKKTATKKAGLASAGKEMDRVDTRPYDDYDE